MIAASAVTPVPRSLSAVSSDEPAIVFEEVSLAFDDNLVLDRISFTLLPGKMKIIMGASGSGKSTILRLILGLLKPDGGHIWVGGRQVDPLSETEMMSVRSNVGMVFQEGALFDSLTVRENVGYRLYEQTHQPLVEVDARVREVLGFVGLADYGDRMPSELSGGQRRRVAIARAVTARPRIMLYDEATTGLDPITALTVDAEIVKLRDLEAVSSVVVTHQLRDAFYIATHEAALRDGQATIQPVSADRAGVTEFLMLRNGTVAFSGTAEQLRATTDSYLRTFLS